MQTTTAPVWLTPAKGGPTFARIDQDDFAASTPDTGTTYRYNSGVYLYNWKTTGAGYYWRISATLDDGQTYYATIGLR